MIHTTFTVHKNKYEYAGTNQYGSRYKLDGQKAVKVLRLSVKYDSDKSQMWELLTLCSSLGVAPVWTEVDGKQCVFIEIVPRTSM